MIPSLWFSSFTHLYSKNLMDYFPAFYFWSCVLNPPHPPNHHHHHRTPTYVFIIISWYVDCPHCPCLFPSQMAQRLLLRRFLTSIISGKPSQSRWAPVASRALQTPQYSPGYLTVAPSQARSIYTTRVCSTTFNIQDGPDFQDRVVNSETPVVVDFHAQWVLGVCGSLGCRLFRYLFIERLLCLSTPFDTSHTWTRGHKKSDTTKWMNNNILRLIAKAEETQSLLSKITCSLIGDRLVNSLQNSLRISMAYSCWCMTQINAILLNNYLSIKNNF